MPAGFVVKPVVFSLLLGRFGESRGSGWEVGFRLGQASEFSLLLSYVALTNALISKDAAHVIQGATIATLIASTYLVILRYPSPIAIDPRLRRD